MSDDVIEFVDKQSKEYKAGFEAGYKAVDKKSKYYKEGYAAGFTKGYQKKSCEFGIYEVCNLLAGYLDDFNLRIDKAQKTADAAYSMAVSKLDI